MTSQRIQILIVYCTRSDDIGGRVNIGLIQSIFRCSFHSGFVHAKTIGIYPSSSSSPSGYSRVRACDSRKALSASIVHRTSRDMSDKCDMSHVF